MEKTINTSLSRQVSRRDFLKGATAVSAFTIVPRHVLGGPGFTSPSDTLNIAGVGVGGMGQNNVRMCEPENIVALCDVDDKYSAKVYERYPNAKRYRDFRIMLEKQKDIDAVIVATPDHTHAVVALMAIQMGNLAVRFPDRRLLWDGLKMEVTNDPEANGYVQRKYREGWSL